MLRLLICNSILDGIRALWGSLNNIFLNLIVGDVFSGQSGECVGIIIKCIYLSVFIRLEYT